MIQQKQGRFRFGSPAGLAPEDRETLVPQLEGRPELNEQPLDGRGGLHVVSTPNLGRVFIKHYLRGGLMRHINERGHLWNPRSRGRREFDALQQAHAGGVRVPEALGWVDSGTVWVNCWLLLREESDARPFSALVREDPDHARTLLPAIADQVSRLVRLQLLHVDLHPGNILLDAQQLPMVIDFDKAHATNLDVSALIERYIERWSRAVAKHGLADAIATDFARHLRATDAPHAP